MTESYPRRKQLYKHKDHPEIFSFANEEEYKVKLKEGYVFDPADLNEPEEVSEEPIPATSVEDIDMAEKKPRKQ